MLFSLKAVPAAILAAAGFTKPLGDFLRALADGGVSRNFVAATASAGAVDLTGKKALAGVITTEALTTAAAAFYTLTITNEMIRATDMVLATVENGTNTVAGPMIGRIAAADGSVVLSVKNTHASAALDGTLKIKFVVIKGA